VLNEGAVGIGVGKMEDLLPAKAADLKKNGDDPTKLSDKTFPYFYQKQISELLAKQNIHVTTEDWGWGEPLEQKETAAFLAGNAPDIIVGETQSPGFAQQGLLEPFPDDMANEIRSKLAPAAWKPMEFNGKIYGLASQPGVNNLFWNKKLFKAAGLDPEQGPKTWDELVQMSDKITAAGAGKFYGGGVYAGANYGGYLRYGPLMIINGGGFVDAGNKPAFNSKSNVETIELLRKLNKDHPKGLMVATNEGPYWDAFSKEQIAMIIDGPWRVSSCVSEKKECGMATIPLSPNGKPGNVTIGAAFHSVPKTAKNKDAAFAYIRAMYSKEVQQLIADAGVRSTIRKDIAETDAYKSAHPEMYSVYKAMEGNVQGLPTFSKDNSKVWQVLGDAVVKSLMTNEDIQGLMDKAQQDALKITQ
jgi:ABC-type glycerol-3-phosphate transport system substrate-binding protein